MDAILAVVAVDLSATSATGEKRENKSGYGLFVERKQIFYNLHIFMSGLVKREQERKMEREPRGSKREREKLFSF